MYEEGGFGVQQDKAKARYWYQRAADQNFIPAKQALAELYYYGEGGPASKGRALVLSINFNNDCTEKLFFASLFHQTLKAFLFCSGFSLQEITAVEHFLTSGFRQ